MLKKNLPAFAMMLGITVLSVFYGVYAERNQQLPALLVEEALNARLTLFSDPPYIKPWRGLETAPTRAQEMMPGLTMLVHFNRDERLAVSVLDSDKKAVHRWHISWFDIWPDAKHIPYFRRPKSEPGTMIHGAAILDNGDLVFNFEHLGMVRVDACANVRWRLAEQSHHSIDIDDNGFIWTSVHHHRQVENSTMPMHYPFYVDPYIYKISPDGEVVAKKSLLSILADNDKYGALFLSSLRNIDPVVRGDTLHVNDVEIFPATLEAGFFQPGDIMVSMRNINSIAIIDPESWKIKHMISHVMLRQHDPDFLDGNTIAVYDNNNRFTVDNPKAYSRIIKIRVPENTVTTVFKGSKKTPFYSRVLGKQQWLENGNILLSDAEHGQALEITRQGEVVWHYVNRISDNKVATIQEATRLPPQMDKAFFRQARKTCHKD